MWTYTKLVFFSGLNATEIIPTRLNTECKAMVQICEGRTWHRGVPCNVYDAPERWL